MKSNLPAYHFNWKGALALIGGAVVPVSVLAVLNVLSMMVLHENFQYSEFFMLLVNMVLWLGAIVAFDYFICRPQTGKPLSFNFSKLNLATYAVVFPMMFGMMLVAEFFTGQIPVTGPFFEKMYEYFSQLMEQVSGDLYIMLATTVVMAPIFEEIVFRGIIQKGMINKGMKPGKAILITALVFGLIHGNPWQFVGAILLGYVLGLAFYKTKSLLLPILLHAFNNLCGTVLLHFYKTDSFGDVFGIPPYIILLVGVIIFGIFYYFFTNRLRIHFADIEE